MRSCYFVFDASNGTDTRFPVSNYVFRIRTRVYESFSNIYPQLGSNHDIPSHVFFPVDKSTSCRYTELYKSRSSWYRPEWKTKRFSRRNRGKLEKDIETSLNEAFSPGSDYRRGRERGWGGRVEIVLSDVWHLARLSSPGDKTRDICAELPNHVK